MAKRCTLKDVAIATGLTVNSVSRALHNKSDISELTKKRVTETAKRLGYVPNFAASSLKRGKSYTVAILFDNLFNPYYNIMTHYLTKYLANSGYDFLTVIENGEKITESTYEKLLSRNVDGLLSFLEPTEEFGKRAAQAKFPVVVLGRHCAQPQTDYVYTDDVRGGYQAAAYLIGKGCKNLCFLADNLDISCAKEREEGFKKCVTEKGVTGDIVQVRGRTYREMVDEILENYPDCDGIACFNDYIAMSAQYLLQRRDRTDIFVIGYDNIRQEFKVPGDCATISADKDKLAEEAVNLLIQRVEGLYEGASRRRVMEVEVVEYDEE